MGGGDLREREDAVDVDAGAARPDELVAPRKSSRVPIVEPITVSCFHQNRWSCAGGLGPLVAPQTTTRPRGGRPRATVPRSPPTVSTTTSTPLPVVSRTAATTSAFAWLTPTSAPQPARPRQLVVVARRDDRPDAEGTADLERRRGDAAADPPDQHPLAFLHRGARDEHPVRRLVDEGERRRDLEREPVVEREDLCGGDRDQLGVRPVAVLADHRDRVAVLEPGVEDDPLARGEPVDAVAERLDHAGAVRAEDPGFGTDGSPLRTQMSRWLSDAALRRTSTSPGPATGSGTSSPG